MPTARTNSDDRQPLRSLRQPVRIGSRCAKPHPRPAASRRARSGRWLGWAVLSLLLLIVPAAAQATTPALHAAGAGERRWVVQVKPEADATVAWIHLKPDAEKDWAPLARLGSAPRAAVAIGPELAVILNNGDWRIYWTNDWRYGTALPDRGRVLALAARAGKVFAIAQRNPAPATTTTTRAPRPDAADDAGQPPAVEAAPPGAAAATAPATSAASPAPSAAPAPEIALFALADGRWTLLAPMPEGVSIDAATDLSMAVAADQPTLAVREMGHLRLFAYGDDGWRSIGSLSGGDVHHFAMLNGPAPRLWTAGEHGIGQLRTFGPDGEQRIDLAGPESAMRAEVRTLATFGDALHLLYLHDEQVVLQPYDDQGQPAGEPAILAAPHAPADPRLGQWIEGALIAAMVFVLITALRQRQLDPPTPKALEGLRLAGLGLRAAAGAIDLWPMWIFAIVVARWIWASPSGMNIILMEGRTQMLFMLASIVYVLHTLIAELLIGRSIGKMVFGLRISDFAGAIPPRGSIIIRNLLRILDVYVLFGLPLLLVLYTPLRQRMGDLAARTVVITKAPRGPLTRIDPSNDDDHSSNNERGDDDDAAGSSTGDAPDDRTTGQGGT